MWGCTELIGGTLNGPCCKAQESATNALQSAHAAGFTCVKPSLLHSDDITTFWTSPYQPHRVRLQRRRPVSPHTRVVVNTSPRSL